MRMWSNFLGRCHSADEAKEEGDKGEDEREGDEAVGAEGDKSDGDGGEDEGTEGEGEAREEEDEPVYRVSSNHKNHFSTIETYSRTSSVHFF